MKYYNYLKEEGGSVTKALGLDEPEVGKDYAPEKVKRYLKIIDDALDTMKSKEENDANDAIVQDLRDKKKSWSNVDKETKPKKTITEPPPDTGEEPPPEDVQEPPIPPEKKPKEQPQESKMKLFLKGGTLDGIDERNLLGLA